MAHRFGNGQCPLVVLLEASLDAMVCAGEDHIDGLFGNSRLLQQDRQ
jgi:hypothetical protein